MKYFTCNSPLLFAVDITNKCNFNCLHCYNDSGCGKNDELTEIEFIEVAKQIAEFKPLTLCFCGGETLLRYELIIAMLDILANNVGIINLVTNGSLLTKEKAYNLYRHGLQGIQISLDGCTAIQHDTFRGFKGAFDLALQAIDFAKDAGLRVGIAISPSKINLPFIEDIFKLVANRGAKEIRLMPIIGMGRASKMRNLLLNADEYSALIEIIEKERVKYRILGINIEWGDPIDHIYRMQNNNKLNLYTYSMEIKSNGYIGASTYFPIYFGNVKKHSLKEYWNNGFSKIWGNDLFLKFISQIKTIQDIENFYEKYNEDILYDIVDMG